MYFNLQLWASTGLAQETSNGNFILRSRQQTDEAVTLVVTVTDKKGAPVKDLPQSAFSIADRKVPQEIVGFDNQDAPASVALIFDISGSMGSNGKISKRVQSAVDALVRFVQLSHPWNEYFLMGFNSKPHLFRETAQDAEVAIAVLNHINTLPFKDNSALYDGLQLGVQKVLQGRYAKRAIIMVTDGQDNNSHSTFAETRRLLQQTDALVYSLSLPRDEDSSLFEEGAGILQEFAEASGGRVFRTLNRSEVNTFIERLAIELRSQYLIRIRPTQPPNKKCNEFKVQLSSAAEADKFKSLSVRARKAYCPQ